jgi:hypothetical protein
VAVSVEDAKLGGGEEERRGAERRGEARRGEERSGEERRGEERAVGNLLYTRR